MTLVTETFRSHPEFPHLSVSDHGGRVFNNKTKRFVGYLSGPRGGDTSERPNPYMRVKVDGNHSRAVSVLVLETFVGPRPDGHDADHEDHDSLNNDLSNLRWLPSKDNQARKVRRSA